MINWVVWGVKLSRKSARNRKFLRDWHLGQRRHRTAAFLQSFKSEQFIPESFCIEQSAAGKGGPLSRVRGVNSTRVRVAEGPF